MDFEALYDAVKERLAVVADHELRDRDSVAHLQRLRDAAERLDRLVAELPKECDPMLRHYLERQSYVKARDWLSAQTGR